MGKAAEEFEDLHIYQRARELTNAIYKITKGKDFARDFGLINQIRRASVSVMSNIAEGFERGSKTELIQFLYISKASCGEVRAQIQIAQDQDYISDNDYQRLYNLCKQISAMTSNFIAHLQKTDYQGDKINRAKRINQNKDKEKRDKSSASDGATLPNYNQQENQ